MQTVSTSPTTDKKLMEEIDDVYKLLNIQQPNQQTDINKERYVGFMNYTYHWFK